MSELTFDVYRTHVVEGIAQSDSEPVTVTIDDTNEDGLIDPDEWSAYLGGPKGHSQGSEEEASGYDGDGAGHTRDGYLYSPSAYKEGDDLNEVLDSMGHRFEPLSLTVPCFAAGTMIETDRGPVAVESLSAGDLVRTRDHGLQPVRWIGSRQLGAAELSRSAHLRPIRIRAGALGPNAPLNDLLVSPQHRVLVRSKVALRMFGAMEVLVAARHLLELDGIEAAADVTDVEYFHFLFDQHEVVYSNGAETESLYTGPEALKAVGPAARDEIFTLFPELRDRQFDGLSPSARPLPGGRQSRKLAGRLGKNNRSAVS